MTHFECISITFGVSLHYKYWKRVPIPVTSPAPAQRVSMAATFTDQEAAAAPTALGEATDDLRAEINGYTQDGVATETDSAVETESPMFDFF